MELPESGIEELFKQDIIPEKYIGHNIPVPIEITIKAMKSICKITIENDFGTGFFMKIYDNGKYLITNHHVIFPEIINKDIIIEIHNHREMKLNFNDRVIKYFPKPKDITMIEMKNYDEIYNDIEFLDYDLNYIRGYINYKDALIFSIQHPLGEGAACSSGRIISVKGFEFTHDIGTDNGSSGSPIILFTKNINLIFVIGIHKGTGFSKNINMGTFIGEIFNNDGNKEINTISNDNNNYIIAEINIKDDQINKDIRIINSYEEFKRNSKNDKELNEEEMNEEQIMRN